MDSVERSFAELQERDELVARGSSRVRLIASSPPPRQVTDTLVIDGDTFAPVEETSVSRTSRFHYVYDGRRVTGFVQRGDSAARPVDATYDAPIFVFNELERMVRGLPDRPGLTAVVPLFSESDADLEHDTLSVIGDTIIDGERAWAVRFADSVIVSRYLVGARGRAVLEVDTRQRRSGILVRQVPNTPAPLLNAPPFEPAVEHFRLVPRGRAQRDTTAWSVTREPQAYVGDSIALQVMIVHRGPRTTIDSVLFDSRTLVPLWEHTHGTDERYATFGPSEVTVHVSSGASVRALVTPTRGFVYSSAMDDLVLQSLPLANGYHAALRFWNGEGIELDTVTVRSAVGASTDSPVPAAWVIEFAEPHTIETVWVDRESRRITGHLYRARQTGAVTEVIRTDSGAASSPH